MKVDLARGGPRGEGRRAPSSTLQPSSPNQLPTQPPMHAPPGTMLRSHYWLPGMHLDVCARGLLWCDLGGGRCDKGAVQAGKGNSITPPVRALKGKGVG